MLFFVCFSLALNRELDHSTDAAEYVLWTQRIAACCTIYVAPSNFMYVLYGLAKWKLKKGLEMVLLENGDHPEGLFVVADCAVNSFFHFRLVC